MKVQFKSIGSDPEIFLINENGEGVPSEEYIKGDKWNVTDLSEELGKGFGILCDNVMVEFNTPPTNDKSEFIKNHKTMLSYISSIVPNYILLDIVASKNFHKDKLKSKLARTFGCEPDFNAYHLEAPNKSPNAKNTTLRTAGGHIHIGYDDVDFDTSIKLIKYMDLFLGVPSILLDTDTERRKMYGNAGSFRFKAYGFEYRTLSNFWLQTTELLEWTWEQVQTVFEKINDENFKIEDEDYIINCINNQDFEAASFLCEKYKIKLLNIKKVNY